MKRFFYVMYGGKAEDNLDSHRCNMYLKTIGKQPVHGRLDLAVLPPLSAAARQHSYRVFDPVQQWRVVDPNPTEWGWKLENDNQIRVTSLEDPVPASIRHLIECNCRAGCERNWECRRAGLLCAQMHGYCGGHG